MALEPKYDRVKINGKSRLVHAVVAERALGRRLPPEAEVHHVDGNGRNNAPTNLVICPSTAYHRLLHTRASALAFSGHVDWLKCIHCQKWDDPKSMKLRVMGENYVRAHHVECNRAYQKSFYDPIKKRESRKKYKK